VSLYDGKGNWTSEALEICDDLKAMLRPALEKALANGMTHSDFCYMVMSETEGLICYDRRCRMRDSTNNTK
jgi:hypothetical protein